MLLGLVCQNVFGTDCFKSFLFLIVFFCNLDIYGYMCKSVLLF